jgi:hypothetical protein
MKRKREEEVNEQIQPISTNTYHIPPEQQRSTQKPRPMNMRPTSNEPIDEDVLAWRINQLSVTPTTPFGKYSNLNY